MKDVEALITAVRQSRKYQDVTPGLIRQLGERELAARRSFKEAVKATKNKLHQVGGAYFEAEIDYEAALRQLEPVGRSQKKLRAACQDIMRRHASTNERLPILESFFADTLQGLTSIRVVQDLACGLNPLARPWMPLDADIEYLACDIYADMMAFVGTYMAMTGMNGRAEVRDLISDPPKEPVDLVFLLKTLPVLEQIAKGAVARLLDALDARYLLISFPAQSLGGRQKGMVQNYEAQFQAWADGRPWQVQRFEFPTELAFLVTVDRKRES